MSGLGKRLASRLVGFRLKSNRNPTESRRQAVRDKSEPKQKVVAAEISMVDFDEQVVLGKKGIK